MSRKISSDNVFHVVRRVAEATAEKKQVLRNELTNLKSQITDQEIWDIIDFFSTDEKVRSSIIIEAVVESGAQSTDSTLRMLKAYGHRENLCQKALVAYEDSIYFREQLFSATESKPLLQKKLKGFSSNHVIEHFC